MSCAISLAICTYNRAAMLADTLASFAQLHGACRAGFELLVIDNNSSDGTEAVVAQFAAAQPGVPLRYLRESRQGLSHARNRAAAEATGEVLVYLDDDVYFDSNVVDAYADAFGADPALMAAGGRIDAHFEAPRPGWLDGEKLSLYSVSNWGDAPRRLVFPEMPIGANMAIRRTALAAGAFNPKLGRDGRTLLSNEEVQLFERLASEGASVAYVPQARVRHRIPAERLTEAWFVSRYYWQGVSAALMEAQAGDYSRLRGLRGALADLRQLLRLLRPPGASPRALYWHLRRPGLPVRYQAAHRWARARHRLKHALVRSKP